MSYGIILLPEAGQAARMVAYARAVGRHNVMVLGERAPAHLTLAHARCDRVAAERWWEAAAAALPPVVEFELAGVMVSPVPVGDFYVPEGGTYVGFEAVKRPPLDHAHRLVLGAAESLGASPLGATGDDFRPHVTLAVLPPGPVVVPPVPGGVLRTPIGARPALGRLGPYGTFPEIHHVA